MNEKVLKHQTTETRVSERPEENGPRKTEDERGGAANRHRAGDERGDERGAGHHSAGGVAIHSAGDDERSADDHQRSAEADAQSVSRHRLWCDTTCTHSTGGAGGYTRRDGARGHERSAGEHEHCPEHESETDGASERAAQDGGRSASDTTHSGYDLSCTGSAGDNDTNDTDDWLNATNHRALWRGGEWSRPEEGREESDGHEAPLEDGESRKRTATRGVV